MAFSQAFEGLYGPDFGGNDPDVEGEYTLPQGPAQPILQEGGTQPDSILPDYQYNPFFGEPSPVDSGCFGPLSEVDSGFDNQTSHIHGAFSDDTEVDETYFDNFGSEHLADTYDLYSHDLTPIGTHTNPMDCRVEDLRCQFTPMTLEFGLDEPGILIVPTGCGSDGPDPSFAPERQVIYRLAPLTLCGLQTLLAEGLRVGVDHIVSAVAFMNGFENEDVNLYITHDIERAEKEWDKLKSRVQGTGEVWEMAVLVTLRWNRGYEFNQDMLGWV